MTPSLPRVLALTFAALFLTSAACTRDGDEPDQTAAYKTVEELRAAGTRAIGTTVTLRATVANVMSPHLARVGARELGEGEGLVVASRAPLTFEAGDTVELQGVVRARDVNDIGMFLNENVNLELYQLEDDDLVLETTAAEMLEEE